MEQEKIINIEELVQDEHNFNKGTDEGGKLIDCQLETPHLLTMGGRHITYEQYMEILQKKE